MSDSKAPLYTRSQYIAGEISHNKYYAQFVTPDMIRVVRNSRIRMTDPISKWNALGLQVKFSNAKFIETEEASNGVGSLTARVCTLKTAFRAILEAEAIAASKGRTL